MFSISRPRSTIVDMTLKVRRKRHEFIRAVSKGCSLVDFIYLDVTKYCR